MCDWDKYRKEYPIFTGVIQGALKYKNKTFNGICRTGSMFGLNGTEALSNVHMHNAAMFWLVKGIALQDKNNLGTCYNALQRYKYIPCHNLNSENIVNGCKIIANNKDVQWYASQKFSEIIGETIAAGIVAAKMKKLVGPKISKPILFFIGLNGSIGTILNDSTGELTHSMDVVYENVVHKS